MAKKFSNEEFIREFLKKEGRLVRSFRKDRFKTVRINYKPEEYERVASLINEINTLAKSEYGFEICLTDPDLEEYEVRYRIFYRKS